MPITRTPWTDDDGTGTTGTILNNAEKTRLYDQIDGCITYGTWTPLDASGAALTFQPGTVGYWSRYGRLVSVWCQVIFPATAIAIPAYIGYVPYPLAPGVPAAGYQGLGIGRHWMINPVNNAFQALGLTTGTVQTNADLSGANITLTSVYLTT